MKAKVPEVRHCVVCGCDQTINQFHPKRSPGPVVQCLSCQLVYVSPILDDSALIRSGPVLSNLDSKVLTGIDMQDFIGCWELSLLKSKLDERTALEFNALKSLELIDVYTRPPGRLLDFGCGWGFYLGIAKDRGWDTYGLEPLPCHASYARAHFGATVITDTLCNNSFPIEFFHVITAYQVFEHLPDPTGDLTKLHRILIKGGIILIEVPNIETWSVRLFGPRHRHFVQDHLTFFSPRTLTLFLENNGFEVLDIVNSTRHMTVRHLLSRWLSPLLPRILLQIAEVTSKRLRFWERIISLNLGDIITVVGRKVT